MVIESNFPFYTNIHQCHLNFKGPNVWYYFMIYDNLGNLRSGHINSSVVFKKPLTDKKSPHGLLEGRNINDYNFKPPSQRQYLNPWDDM